MYENKKLFGSYTVEKLKAQYGYFWGVKKANSNDNTHMAFFKCTNIEC